MKIALIIFTKNELENLKEIFARIPQGYVDNVYAVDAKSEDGTREFFKKEKIKIIDQRYKGVGGAYEAAVSQTKEDALIFFHPDGNMNPADIKEFARRLREGEEFIVASRMISGAVNEEDEKLLKPRKWFCQLLGLIANTLWSKNGNKSSDITQGFRAITRNTYSKLKIKVPNAVAPDYEQIIRCLKLDIKIDEFPTKEGARVHGNTSMKSIPTGIENIKVLVREMLGK